LKISSRAQLASGNRALTFDVPVRSSAAHWQLFTDALHCFVNV